MHWRTSKPGGRRLLLAAAAAVAFHLLLALALGLLRPPAPPAPARPPPSIAVVLQGKPSPPVAQGGTAARPGGGEADSTQAKGRPRRRAGPAKTVAKGEGDRPAGEGLARGPERGPLTKEEVAEEGLAREPGSAGVTTTLRDPIATLDPRGGPRGEPRQGPVHVPSREEQLVEEKTRVEDTVRGWTEEYLALGRARDPQDVYWRDMQEALSRNFQLDFEVSKRKDDKPTSSLQEAAAAYQRSAESYGKTGSAYGVSAPRSLNASVAAGPVPNEDRGLGSRSLEPDPATPDVMLLARAAFAEEGRWNKKLVVLIQIVQGPDGDIETARITTTSGNKDYDGTALAQVRKLAGKGLLGVPPSGHRRTVWAFETDFSTYPPLPVGGCTLDATFLPRDCYYPFKRTVHSRIHLEAIY